MHLCTTGDPSIFIYKIIFLATDLSYYFDKINIIKNKHYLEASACLSNSLFLAIACEVERLS